MIPGSELYKYSGACARAMSSNIAPLAKSNDKARFFPFIMLLFNGIDILISPWNLRNTPGFFKSFHNACFFVSLPRMSFVLDTILNLDLKCVVQPLILFRLYSCLLGSCSTHGKPCSKRASLIGVLSYSPMPVSFVSGPSDDSGKLEDLPRWQSARLPMSHSSNSPGGKQFLLMRNQRRYRHCLPQASVKQPIL